MSLLILPQKSRDWLPIARAALDPDLTAPVDELLLVRDQAGQRFRPLGPPTGVVARDGAVLILLYPDEPDMRLPLTIRSERLPHHRGEVSLPGGATDPDDEGPIATALRECEEEIGTPANVLSVLGTLSPIYIMPSNFLITPVVAVCESVPPMQINPDEVSAVINVTLRELLAPETVVVERRNLRGVEVEVPYFAIAGQKVWGATALILSEFAARLRQILLRAAPPSEPFHRA